MLSSRSTKASLDKLSTAFEQFKAVNRTTIPENKLETYDHLYSAAKALLSEKPNSVRQTEVNELTKQLSDFAKDLPAQIQISAASVSGINAKYAFTGNAITPKPVLKREGKQLAEGKDYKLTYSGNVNPGKATITITGIGNYTGSITRTFEIVKTDQSSVRPVSMHRLYNPNSGEHFYTKNTKEKDHLVSLGWKYEGEGWKAPETSKVPVYRLYNKNAGDHHYTFDKNEKDYLVKLGWNDEGIGWYSDEAKGVPLYRQYNPNAKAGSHNYTTNKNENDGLVKLGWKAEGIAWYGMK